MIRAAMTRETAFDLLTAAGFPTGTFPATTGLRLPFLVVQVAVAGAESDLIVEATNEANPNPDGSIDRGWLQINSRHGYDPDLLVTDPAYCAAAGFDVLARQGLGAWAAYSRGPYIRRLPPAWGGPDLARGLTQPPELVKTVQGRLQALGYDVQYIDGQFGAETETALMAWKKVACNDGHRRVDARVWTRLGVR